MRYINNKTGVIIDSPFKIIGKAWELMDGKATEEKTVEYVEEEVNLEEMTNKQLEEFAKEHEIELTKEDKKNKENLLNVIAKAFE